MGGTKQAQQSNTASQSTPWGPVQPGLQMGINAANSAFQSGIGSQPYTASMVTPFAQQSTDAFNRMTSLANQFQPGMTAGYQGVANLAKKGGLTDMQKLSMSQLAPFAASKPVEGLAQLNDIQRQGYNYLNPIAAGRDRTGNPYLDEVIRRSSNDITGAENLGASAAGRYGSGGHQMATQKAIGDMAAPLRFQDYNTQQGRMDTAIQNLFGMGNQANTQYEADMARKQAAITGQFNAGQQQWENIAGLPGQLAAGYNTAMMPAQTLRTVGGEYEDLMSKNKNDLYRIFQAQQQQPWGQIGLLNSALSGGGANSPNFGTQMGYSQAPGTSRLMSGLGGAIGGGALNLGPWGALAGGIAGAYG